MMVSGAAIVQGLGVMTGVSRGLKSPWSLLSIGSIQCITAPGRDLVTCECRKLCVVYHEIYSALLSHSDILGFSLRLPKTWF